MAVDRFQIGFVDNKSGLQTNYQPWLIADNAFALLQNAYIFRGRLRKRFGSILIGDSQLSSRLRMALVPVVLTVTTPSNIDVGQQFSIGTDIFTVNDITPPYPVNLLSTSNTVTAQLVSANQVTFSAIAATVYWYPALPVMGITQYETQPINDEPTFAFDTKFAYEFNDATSGWERLGTEVWTGGDADFFWADNYQGGSANETVLFVTNFVDADGIKYWDGSTWTTPTLQYANNAPGPNNIVTARIIISFQNRLLLLNTVETVDGVSASYVNRCRYSGFGNALDTNAWREDIPGNGSAIDATTQEAIVTAQIIKNRLIVYFERSTWELVFTNNQVNPFLWQQLNTELGAESTFSQVPFDKVVLGVGQVGIMACNGVNVERIDAKIPQLVFDIHNEDNGPIRVGGIRDYNSELVYWTYPQSPRSSTSPYPNKVLVYNYVNDSWGINDDSITAFGYFQVGARTTGITWGSVTDTWGEYGEPWGFGSVVGNIKTRTILAGNQQGFTFIIDRNVYRNCPSLQVTDVDNTNTKIPELTVYNHNLDEDDYILIENMNGLTITQTIVQVLTVIDENTFTVYSSTDVTGTYKGGGTLSRVSEINILTKQYNFYAAQDRNAYISKVDFLIDKVGTVDIPASITIDFYVSTSAESGIEGGTPTGALLGTSSLDTSPYSLISLESTQDRLWHPVYFQADGECIQLRLYYNSDQMLNESISLRDFQLHAMNFFAQPTTARLT